MVKRIIYTSIFAREYRHLPQKIKDIAEEKENIFRRKPFDSRLKTHKLKGKLNEFWSFSITQKYRIVFEFADDHTVYFHLVGTHEIYQ